MAHNETRMGTVEFKTKKHLGKSRIMWHSLKGKKAQGVIGEDKELGIIEIAKPIGVVGCHTALYQSDCNPNGQCHGCLKRPEYHNSSSTSEGC